MMKAEREVFNSQTWGHVWCATWSTKWKWSEAALACLTLSPSTLMRMSYSENTMFFPLSLGSMCGRLQRGILAFLLCLEWDVTLNFHTLGSTEAGTSSKPWRDSLFCLVVHLLLCVSLCVYTDATALSIGPLFANMALHLQHILFIM